MCVHFKHLSASYPEIPPKYPGKMGPISRVVFLGGLVGLQLRDVNNLILTISSEVLCGVTSLYDNNSTTCDVSRVSSGMYTFPYTPTVRGRHTVTMTVDENALENSFPFFVVVSPNTLDKPVKVWKVPAFGLTVNSAGDILVSASGNNIDKLTGKGKSLQVKHRDFLVFEKSMWIKRETSMAFVKHQTII